MRVDSYPEHVCEKFEKKEDDFLLYLGYSKVYEFCEKIDCFISLTLFSGRFYCGVPDELLDDWVIDVLCDVLCDAYS